MPTVPVYGDRRVRSEALRPVFQNTPDVSSGAQALARGVQNVAGEIDKSLEFRAETKAQEVDAQLTREWIDWENANRGKYTNQAAEGYKNAVDTWWKEAGARYGAELDPLTRSKVGKTLTRRQVVAIEQAGRYEFAEKEKYADSTAASAMSTATVNALRTGDYEGEAARIRDIVMQQGARKNWDKDQRDAEINARLGTHHTAVVTQLAEQDAEKAKAYLESAIQRGEIPADRQVRMEAVIEGEAANQFAQKFAAENATLPYDQQLKAASEIDDPKRREKALQQIKLNHAQVKEAQRVKESEASDQAWQLAAQGRRIPEAVLSQMDGRERMQLQESLRARSERLAAGGTVKTDMATYIDVREKLAAGERVDLRAYTEKIAPAQMEQLLDIQTSGSKGGVKQDAMLTDEGRINSALVGLAIDKKKNPEAATAFTLEIDRRVRAESAAKGGKELTADEKQRIVDAVTMDKVYVDEWGRDPQTPLALVDPDKLQDAYVMVGEQTHPIYGTSKAQRVDLNSIPANDRAQITAALKKRGLPVTEQRIAELYVMNKKGK